jgi:murein tripeptide amidase MpaA
MNIALMIDKSYCPKSKSVDAFVDLKRHPKYVTSIDREAAKMAADFEPSVIDPKNMTSADREAAKMAADFEPSVVDAKYMTSVDREALELLGNIDHDPKYFTSINREVAEPNEEYSYWENNGHDPECAKSTGASIKGQYPKFITSVDEEAAKLWGNIKN